MITNLIDFHAFHILLFENIKEESVTAIVNTPDYLSTEQIDEILDKGFYTLVRKEPEISARMFVALAKALDDHRGDLNIEIIDYPTS